MVGNHVGCQGPEKYELVWTDAGVEVIRCSQGLDALRELSRGGSLKSYSKRSFFDVLNKHAGGDFL